MIRLVWALTGGLLLGACFYAVGLLLCCTIIGIPLGIAVIVGGWKIQTLGS